jgi:hypothetical protein
MSNHLLVLSVILTSASFHNVVLYRGSKFHTRISIPFGFIFSINQ